MGKRKYYWRWLYIAFRHSVGFGDGIAFFIGIAFPIIRQFIPIWEAVMNELAWQIPLGVFSSIIILRLILAPYWIYKKVEDERNALLNIAEKNGVIVVKHPPQVNIPISEVIFGVSGDNGFPPSSVGGKVRWMRLSMNIRSNVHVETLELTISGKDSIPAHDWKPGQGAYYYYFQIPDWAKSKEERTIQVRAFANGLTWGSREMSITFP